MKCYLLGSLFLMNLILYSQNEVIVSQHNQNVFGLSSAVSCITNQPEANLYYKKLWSGFRESPELLQITLAGPIKHKKFGIGLNVVSQQAGIFAHIIAQAAIAYKIELTNNHFLSFGIQGGINRLQINFNKINAYDVDELLNFPKFQTSILPTADFSLAYSNKTLVVFFSANQILKGRFNFYDATYKSSISSQVVPNYLVGTKWDKKLTESFKNTVSLIFRSPQGLPLMTEVSDIITWEQKLALGAGYRQTYSMYALARVQITQNILMGYCYEYNMNNYNIYTQGGHELNICYKINNIDKEKELKKKLSNENILDIYNQMELANKKLENNKKQTDSLSDKTNDLIKEINDLKKKQGNQEEIKRFMDSLKNSTLNVKDKRNFKVNIQNKKTNSYKKKKLFFVKRKSGKISKPEKKKEELVISKQVATSTIKAKTVTPKEEELLKEQKLKTKSVELLVKDKKKLKLINTKIIVTDIKTKEQIMLKNVSVGSWKGFVNEGGKYKIIFTGIGYHTLELDLDSIKDKEVFLEPMKVGENFIMKSIYFHPNSYALKKESEEELKKLLEFMVENPTINIEIQGHTNGDNRIYKNKDFKGMGEEWNFRGSSKKLSANRANAIKNYLINNSIASYRITVKGMGGSKPIIENPETMSEGQRNIRVEILIIKD